MSSLGLPLNSVECDNIYNLLVEVYSAANDEQFRLLAMGVRAVLDHVMTRIVGDIGGFERKLAEMVTKEHLSSRQKEMPHSPGFSGRRIAS